MFAVMLAAALGASTPNDVLGTAVNVLDAPTEAPRFIERPSASDFAAAYPHGAAVVGMGGKALLRCQVGQGGRLDGCQVKSETPEGAGFGAPALRLAPSSPLSPETPPTPPSPG